FVKRSRRVGQVAAGDYGIFGESALMLLAAGTPQLVEADGDSRVFRGGDHRRAEWMAVDYPQVKGGFVRLPPVKLRENIILRHGSLPSAKRRNSLSNRLILPPTVTTAVRLCRSSATPARYRLPERSASRHRGRKCRCTSDSRGPVSRRFSAA